MDVTKQTEQEPRPGDIIFLCPECTKSISIDPRGAGLMVTCPDCQSQIQVPLESEPAALEAAEENLSVSDEPWGRDAESVAAQALREELEGVRDQFTEVSNRRKILERERVANIRRMERVAEELAVIQSALDRITSVFQEAAIDEATNE